MTATQKKFPLGSYISKLLLRMVIGVLSLAFFLLIAAQVALWAGVGWLHTREGEGWLNEQLAAATAGTGYTVTLGAVGSAAPGGVHLGSFLLTDATGPAIAATDVTVGVDLPTLMTHRLALSFAARELTVHHAPASTESNTAATPVAWPDKRLASIALDKINIRRLVLDEAVTGMAIDTAVKGALEAKPQGDDIQLNLALALVAKDETLPKKINLSGALLTKENVFSLEAAAITGGFYRIGGTGHAGLADKAPMHFDLTVESDKLPGNGGALQGTVTLDGTTDKLTTKAAGTLRHVAQDVGDVKFTAEVIGDGGHLSIATAYQQKPLTASADISYVSDLLQLKNFNIKSADMSAAGRVDVVLKNGAQSIHATLGKLKAGEVSIDGVEADVKIGKPYIVSLKVRSAKKGNIDASGTIGVDDAALPVNINIKADRIAPFRRGSDVRGTFSGNLVLKGNRRQYAATGTITTDRIDIAIPERINADIAKLNIVTAKQKQEAAPDFMKSVKLDINLIAKNKIFVLGRGLDAEFGGTLAVTGTPAEPLFNGTFKSLRGRYEEFGKRFDISRAQLNFRGTVPPSPYLDVLAVTTTDGMTAEIALTGSVDALAINLTSIPAYPQDEVLSRLLFGKNMSKISPFQAIQVANTLRKLAGHGGGGPEPLAILRKAVGVDDLSVESDGKGATTVGAGKYITDKVYLQAQSGSEGKGGAAKVKIDITPHVKAESKIGQDSGAGGSILWQWDY